MTLKVAVLVKQVPDLEALVRVASEQRLEIEDRYVCSFFDEIALEAALELGKAHADVELVALSAGGKRAVDALRRAVAMGIDAIEQVESNDLETADSFLVAAALAARLRQLQPDLVLCGKQAGDDDQGAVGPMVAELLGAPHASAVVSIEIDPATRTARVGRKVEGQVWTLDSPLPLLVTAEKGLAEPHVPVVTRVMKAMRAKPSVVALADLGIEVPPVGRVERLGYIEPPERPAVTMLDQPFPQNVAELVKRLQQAGVLS
jgi:electron transfer flavoprotein beta subunit